MIRRSIRHDDQNMKYTAPSKHKPAQKIVELKGSRIYTVANGAKTDKVMTS